MINDEFLYKHMPRAEALLLSKIPDENELSHVFSNRFNRKMKALLKYERQTPTMSTFTHRLKIAAAICLITLTLTFGSVMRVEAYRIRLFEFVTQVWETLTSIVTHSDGFSESDQLLALSPSYVPEGYTLLEETKTRYEYTIIYVDPYGTEIYYSQTLLTQGEVILDTENAEMQSVLIGTQEVFLIANKGLTQLYWHDDLNAFSLIGKIYELVLIKMAESVKK